MVNLKEQYLLVVGGFNLAEGCLDTIEFLTRDSLLDESFRSNLKFSLLSMKLSVGRQSPIAFSMDNKIVVFGGYNVVQQNALDKKYEVISVNPDKGKDKIVVTSRDINKDSIGKIRLGKILCHNNRI